MRAMSESVKDAMNSGGAAGEEPPMAAHTESERPQTFAAALSPPMAVGVIESPSSQIETEVAVIGSGPGGAVTAAMLAESGYETHLLEAGGLYSQAGAAPFGRREMAAYARGGMTATVGRAPVNYVVGRCLGGGSEVNSGLYHRAPAAALARWAAAAHGADDAELAVMSAANEADINVTQAPGEAQPASAALAAGAEALGLAVELVPRWHKYDDSYSPLAPGGVRQSMSETFLPRFARSGGRILPMCVARRLEAVAGGGGWKIHARAGRRFVSIVARDVFVAAGAIQTPILLRRSGIKNNVGDALRMHIFVRMIAEFEGEVNAEAAGIGAHQAVAEAGGAAARIGCAVSTPAHMAAALAQCGAGGAEWLATHEARWRRRAAYYISFALGGGRVRSAGGDEAALYRFGADDFYVLADGVRYLARALFAARAVRVIPVFGGAGTLFGEGDLWRLPRPLRAGQCRLSSVHLMASCAMGAVADSFGRVYGHPGLHIADSSLFYDSLGVNPQGTVMSFARRNIMTYINARQK